MSIKIQQPLSQHNGTLDPPPCLREHTSSWTATSVVQTSSSTSPETFHKFNSLPYELQAMIWELALPHRIIQPTRDRGGHGHCLLLPTQQDPSILQVSHQSRIEAKRFFHLRHLDLCYTWAPRPCQYISPRFDVLCFKYFADFHRGGISVDNTLARCYSSAEMRSCETVALQLHPSWHIGEVLSVWIAAWMTWFPSVKSLWVVVNDNLCLWHHLVKAKNQVLYATSDAFKKVKDKMRAIRDLWEKPEVRFVTLSDFNFRWQKGLDDDEWARNTKLGTRRLESTEVFETADVANIAGSADLTNITGSIDFTVKSAEDRGFAESPDSAHCLDSPDYSCSKDSSWSTDSPDYSCSGDSSGSIDSPDYSCSGDSSWSTDSPDYSCSGDSSWSIDSSDYKAFTENDGLAAFTITDVTQARKAVDGGTMILKLT